MFFVALAIFIIPYSIICYINYRIVAKFDPTVKFGENLVPIWNTYLLAKEVMPHPKRYIAANLLLVGISLVAMVSIIGFSFNEFAFRRLQDFQWFFDLLKFISAILYAYLWGCTAKALGKRRWLHCLFGLLTLPLLISVPIMAFDKSRPVDRPI